MSNINIIHNFSTKKWTAKTEMLSSNQCQLQIGFASNDGITVFDNLKLGYDIRNSIKVTQSNSFPEDPDIKYKSTNEEFLISETINLEPNTKYTINLWVKNGTAESKFKYNIETPDNTDLGHYPDSSVPHPNNDRHDLYKFDTSTRTWVRK